MELENLGSRIEMQTSAMDGHERSSMACSQPTLLGSHLRCSSQPPLASVVPESDVQGCRADVHGSAPTLTSVDWFVSRTYLDVIQSTPGPE